MARLLVLGHGDLWLHRGPLAAVGDRLPRGLAYHRFNDLGHGGLAVDAAQMVDRHLARPKALEADAILQLIEALGEPLSSSVAGDRHRQATLQAFGEGFVHLHVTLPVFSSDPRRERVTVMNHWRDRLVSHRHSCGLLVRAEGLEPPRAKPTGT